VQQLDIEYGMYENRETFGSSAVFWYVPLYRKYSQMRCCVVSFRTSTEERNHVKGWWSNTIMWSSVSNGECYAIGVCVWVYVCMYVCVCVLCMFVCVCMYVCVYLYECVYTCIILAHDTDGYWKAAVQLVQL
jgi:hypothetical protein